MKKNILIVVFLLISFSAGAFSGVLCRKVFDNGLYVQSDYEYTQKGISFSLIFEKGESDDSYEGYSFIFRISSRENDYKIPYGGKMLIKTSTEEIISLTQCADGSIRTYVPETGAASSIYTVERVTAGNISSIYYVSGKYHISNDDLKKILDSGIVKIRVQTNGDYMDFEFPMEEKFSDGLFTKKITENMGRYYFRKMNAVLNENIDGRVTFVGDPLPDTYLYTN